MALTGGGLDGRVLRGRRNRNAVVESFLSLIEEGAPRPTARQIAERAGVSLRSVFQHFNDLEQIYAAAGRREYKKLLPYLEPVDPSIPFAERLDRFVERRATALDALDPVARAARLREPFSTQLTANRDYLVKVLRAQVKQSFAPELAALPPDVGQAALDAAAVASSWSTWYCLREELGCDTEEAAARVRLLLAAVLESAEPGANR